MCGFSVRGAGAREGTIDWLVAYYTVFNLQLAIKQYEKIHFKKYNLLTFIFVEPIRYSIKLLVKKALKY